MARLERKPAQHVAVAGLIIQFVAAVLGFVFWKLSNAATVWVFAWQGLIGTLVWITTIMHLRNSSRAEEEQIEWERLEAERAAGGARGSLFEEDEIQAFSARNRLRIFQKFIVPVMASVIILLQVGIVLLTYFKDIIPQSGILPDNMKVLLCDAGSFALAFLLFLIAMYAAGMSRQKEWRPLRACAGYMMFTFLFLCVSVVALSLGYFQHARPDRFMAYVMLASMVLVALEMLLNLVLDFYRPRVEGVEARDVYDSRLLGLLAEPGNVLKTVATTLDYQFGFRVSQTWFYRFLEKSIAPLLLFQLVFLYLITCFVIVGPEQGAVWERFGKFKQAIDKPGLYMKLPWPFDRIYRFSASETKVINLGHSGRNELPDKILWTAKHYENEFPVLVAANTVPTSSTEIAPVNLLVATTTVRYRISNVKDWYYNCSQPAELLAAVCEQEQIKYFAGVDLFKIMEEQRGPAADDLQRNMQAAADKVQLGVTIMGVGLEGIHPPYYREEGIDVPGAFHDQINAKTEYQKTILDAQTERIKTLAEGTTQAKTMKLSAQGDYVDKVAIEKANAERFSVQCKAFADSKEVFKAREYLSAIEQALQQPRKFVIAVKDLDREMVRLNLEDPVELSITGIPEFRTGVTQTNIAKQQEAAAKAKAAGKE